MRDLIILTIDGVTIISKTVSSTLLIVDAQAIQSGQATRETCKIRKDRQMTVRTAGVVSSRNG